MEFDVNKLDEYKEQILKSKKDKAVIFESDGSYIIVPSYDAMKFYGGITLFYSYKFGWNLFKRHKNVARNHDWKLFKTIILGGN